MSSLLGVSASERIPELDHTLALGRVGQASITEIVAKMTGIGSCRDCARHGRMRHDEFQEELRPSYAAELSRPGRNSDSTHAAEQIAPTERTVRDNADSAIGRKRQYSLLRVAHIDRVRQLYEVNWLALDDRRKLGKRGRCVVRNPDISYLPRFLHSAQRRKMSAPVQQIMNLHEVDDPGSQELGRAFHLRDSRLPARGPYLGRDKSRFARVEFGE